MSRTQIIFSILFLFAVVYCNGEALMGTVLSAKRVNIPVYEGTMPVALLKVDRIFQEYPRKGFLRIGVAPRPVLQGITVSILDTADPTNAFRQVCRKIRAIPSVQYCQMRDVTIVYGKTRLLLGAVGVSAVKDWPITGSVSLESNGQILSSQGGSLVAGGLDIGRVSLITSGGPITVNFLQVPEHKQPNPNNETQNSFNASSTGSRQ